MVNWKAYSPIQVPNVISTGGVPAPRVTPLICATTVPAVAYVAEPRSTTAVKVMVQQYCAALSTLHSSVVERERGRCVVCGVRVVRFVVVLGDVVVWFGPIVVVGAP